MAQISSVRGIQSALAVTLDSGRRFRIEFESERQGGMIQVVHYAATAYELLPFGSADSRKTWVLLEDFPPVFDSQLSTAQANALTALQGYVDRQQ